MGVKIWERETTSGTYLYLIIQEGNRTKQEALGFKLGPDRKANAELRRKAKQIAAKRELDFESVRHGLLPTHRRRSPFLEYCEKIADEHTNPNTRLSWKNALDHVRAFAEKRGGADSFTFEGVTREWVEGLRAFLLSRVSANSAGVYLARLKTIIHRAQGDGYFLTNPAQNVNVKKTEPRTVFLTIEEVRKLQATPCANETVKNAFLFMCATSLRISDTEALTWENIEGDELVYRQRKTGSPERLPLSPDALQILDQQRATAKSERIVREIPIQRIFPLPSQPVTDKELKKWGVSAGLTKRLSAHKARHTAATLLLSSGASLYTTSKILGHRSLATSTRYAKVVDEQKRAAVAAVPSFMKGGSNE